MDSNIDPNIDPSMESNSGIFTKFSINNDFHSHQDGEQVHDDFINQQYIDDNGGSNSNSASAAAAAVAAAANLSNIINFNHLQGLQDRSNTSSPPPHSSSSRPQDNLIASPSQQTIQRGSLQSLQHREDPLNFIHDTLTSLDQENNGSSQQHHLQHHHHQEQSPKPSISSPPPSSNHKQPKQRIIHDADSQVSIVVVNPASTEGTRRLGRPRKNIPKQTNSPANSSTQNLDKSLVSRFRFDSLPVIGPGSRGGRKKKPGIVTKPGRQTRFEKGSRGLKLVPQDNENKEDPKDGPSKQSVDEVSKTSRKLVKDKKDNAKEEEDLIVVEEIKKKPAPKSQPKIILEDYHSLKAKGRSTAKDDNNSKYSSDVFTKLGLVPQTKKTHVVKKRKDTPGAIVGAYYDMYEPDLVDGYRGSDQDMNLIALGFEVTPAPYARDIMTILEFTNKFKSIFDEFHSLGPQDFEEGLKLRPSTVYPLDNAKQITAEQLYEDGQNDDHVSQLMNRLLFQLLTLVLNRKRPIDKSGLTRALEDLKSQVLHYGLPSEWRDDSELYSNPEMTVQGDDEEPVDPENIEIFDSTQYKFGQSRPLAHTPLDNEEFEAYGLDALEPKDRLVLLRSLAQWCLSNSDVIKQELYNQLAKQESGGEKETYYISRFIKDGSKGVEAALQDRLNSKRRKQQSQQKIDEKDSMPEAREASNELSTNPTSNPLDHHMSFRLLDFYAGDGGINGRFYLCRTSNSKTGGLASFQEITSVLKDNESIHDLLAYEQPSRFKLYVQDVTTMLSGVYKSESSVYEESEEALDPWYEIAGNTEQLGKFLEHLSSKLTISKSKQLTNLYDYLNTLLPILIKYETIQKDYRPTRSSRKREQIADYRENDKRLKQILAKHEGEDDEFLNKNGSDGDEDDDDDAFDALVEADDDDDDDYRE